MAEFIRVLQCFTCKTLEVLPDYEGDPRNDGFLERASEPHNRGEHLGNLLRIDKKDWDVESTRKQVIEKIWESSGHSGFDPSYYETKDQFTYDAHVCFQRHNRNPDCSDYKSDRMIIRPDTAAERKAAGLNPKHRAGIHLCNFCPVHSRYRAAQFDKNGSRN